MLNRRNLLTALAPAVAASIALPRTLAAADAVVASVADRTSSIRITKLTATPTLTVKTLPHGQAEAGFYKSSSQGINLYCQRGSETAPTFRARDTNSPYVDNRPLLVAGQPETRTSTPSTW